MSAVNHCWPHLSCPLSFLDSRHACFFITHSKGLTGPIGGSLSSCSWGFSCVLTGVLHLNNVSNISFQISHILGVLLSLCLLQPTSSTPYHILSVCLLLPKDQGEHAGSRTLPAQVPRRMLDFGGSRWEPGLRGQMAVIATARSLSRIEKDG